MLLKGKSTVINYWKSVCIQWDILQPLGLKIFSLVASSAESERNFSDEAFIHSAKRNRLSSERVEKSVRLRCNLPSLTEDYNLNWTKNQSDDE